MRKKLHCNNKCPLSGQGWTSNFLVLLLVCTLATMVSADRSMAFAAGLEILTPRPDSRVLARNPETHLVLRESEAGEASRVKVEKSGEILKPVEDIEGEAHNYLHFRLPLKSGKNTFTIIPAGQRLEVTYQPLQAHLPSDLKSFYLFHQDDQLPESCVDCHDLQETTTIDLVGLKSQTSCGVCHKNMIGRYTWQHSTTVNQQCLSCHQRYIKPWRIGFREGRIDETCYACHTDKSNWPSRKHRHGALIGGCTLCHNPHGGKYRYLLWAEGTLELCVTCHGDKQKLLDKDKPVPYVHGIIFGKGCTACHDPHATENSSVLLKPINELCISCHQGLAAVSLGHPVDRHPVSGPSERRRPDRKLTCVGCHDPHGSPYKNMLIGNILGGSLCRVCHSK